SRSFPVLDIPTAVADRAFRQQRFFLVVAEADVVLPPQVEEDVSVSSPKRAFGEERGGRRGRRLTAATDGVGAAEVVDQRFVDKIVDRRLVRRALAVGSRDGQPVGDRPSVATDPVLTAL